MSDSHIVKQDQIDQEMRLQVQNSNDNPRFDKIPKFDKIPRHDPNERPKCKNIYIFNPPAPQARGV